MPPPSSMPKRVYKDLRNCIGLLSQRNYKQSETEFKKFIKNHGEYKECLLAKTLTLYFDIFHHNRQDFDEDLMQLIESTKTIGKADDDSMAPFLIIDIFNHIKRRDKSAAVCKIYCDRYGGKELYKYYFEYLIQLFDFNEQSKVAVKMYQLDKESEPNKFQLCSATFLQAASKPTTKEREMGFEFAAKLAQKLFANNPEFLEGYLKSVEEAKIRYAEKPFLDGNGYASDLDGDENAEMEETKNKEKLNEVETEVKLECFKTSFDALKEGPRSEKLWHETLGFLPDTNADHPKTEAYSTLASFFQELQQQSPQLLKEDLFACIEFLNAAEPEDYGIGTFGERVNEYIERFGHDFHEYQNILPYFHSLSDVEEQKKIIENSNKILEILKPYLGKKSEIGVESVVIDARDEIIEPKDVEALGSANIPTGILEIIMGYYHRVFLTDQMKLLSGEIETISELEKMIDNWMKIVNTLDNQDIILDARVVTCQEFSEHIINAIFTVLFETYAANENVMYLEILSCLLLYHQHKHFSYTDASLIFICHFTLGFIRYFKDVALSSEFPIDPNAVYIYENTGHFKVGHDFYQQLIDQKLIALRQDEAILKENYGKGKVENVCTLYERINYKMNDLDTARYFLRGKFLEAIFGPFDEFYGAFYKNKWPAELPHYSNEDPSSYCSEIAEIKTVRILCHFLMIFADYKSDDAAAFNSIQEDLEYYVAIITAQNSAKEKEIEQNHQLVTTSSNIFENAVIQPFLKLINIYIKSVANVLSSPTQNSVDGIVESLPDVSTFQTCVDEVSKLLHNLFRQKFKNVQRIRALSDTVKMLHYMSRLIFVTYKAIGKNLNAGINVLYKNEEFKAILLRFRLYSVELKLLMEIVTTFAQKFMKCLALFPGTCNPHPSHDTLFSTSSYAATRFYEYRTALSTLICHQELSSLINVGLLKPSKNSEEAD